VGETNCPACGAGMRADAYRCPHCRIYLCFSCRRRVQTNEAQYQCVNQHCGQHGKLLCGHCIEFLEFANPAYLIQSKRQEEIATTATKRFGERELTVLFICMGLATSVTAWLLGATGGGAGVLGVIATMVLFYIAQGIADDRARLTPPVPYYPPIIVQPACAVCKHAVQPA
jgi:hypothetical protein